MNGKYYHLHREFITKNDDNQEIAIMCLSCHEAVTKGQIPNFSIAAGVDFGNPGRIGLPLLSIAEQYVVNPFRMYMSIVKLSGRHPSEQQTGSKGHVITVAHENQAVLEAIVRSQKEKDRSTYPRIEGFHEAMSVIIVGAKLQCEAMVPSLLSYAQELKIDHEKVFKWLRVLKAVNPHFIGITIDDSEEMRESLLKLSEALVHDVTFVNEKMENEIEKLVQQETVPAPFGYDNFPTDSEDKSDLPLASVFLTKSNLPPTDINAPDIALLQGNLLHMYLLTLLFFFNLIMVNNLAWLFFIDKMRFFNLTMV